MRSMSSILAELKKKDNWQELDRDAIAITIE